MQVDMNGDSLTRGVSRWQSNGCQRRLWRMVVEEKD